MSKNKIFVITAKAEHEGTSLSTDLKRMLSYIDGKTRSGELAKHAPPSLRKKWDALLNELVEGGYIVDDPEANIDRKFAQRKFDPMEMSVPKTGASTTANDLDYRSTSAATRVAAERAKQTRQEAVRSRAELKTAAAAVKVSSDAEAEAKQKAEKAARARAELRAFFAAAKEKAKAEAKQTEQQTARARAELEAAAAAAKVRSDAEAKAKAAAKQREQEAARARAELEAAAAAAKVRSDAEAKTKAAAKLREQEAARARAGLEASAAAAKIRPDVEAKTMDRQEAEAGMHASDAQRLRNLEMENDILKKLLVEAYLEIETLKTSFGVKR